MEPAAGLLYVVMIAGSSDYRNYNTRTRAQRDPACSRLLWIRGPIVRSLSISQAILSGGSPCGLVHLELMKEELRQARLCSSAQHFADICQSTHKVGGSSSSACSGLGLIPATTLYPLFSLSPLLLCVCVAGGTYFSTSTWWSNNNHFFKERIPRIWIFNF